VLSKATFFTSSKGSSKGGRAKFRERKPNLISPLKALSAPLIAIKGN